MVKTLKKFKESEYVLLAALQIFILEPAFNWLNLAKKRMQEQNENNEQGSASMIKPIWCTFGAK